MKLTKREKRLLFIVTVLCLVYLPFQFIIVPLNKLYSAGTEEYDRLSAEKMQLDLKLQSENMVLANRGKAEKAFDEIKSAYPAVMPNEELDRLLTGLCVKNDLSPAVLSISDTVGFDKERQTGRGGSSIKETEASKGSAARIASATMTVYGDYSSLKGLISTVEAIDYIRITRVALSHGQNVNRDGLPGITLLFEITMLDEERVTEVTEVTE